MTQSMRSVEIKVLELQLDSLTIDLTAEGEDPELTILLSHSSITDEVANHYQYDAPKKKLQLQERLMIQITHLHITPHKYALLSFYSSSKNQRKKLIGSVPINIARTINKGAKELVLKDCFDPKSKVLLSLAVKTYSQSNVKEMLEQVKNYRNKCFDNTSTPLQRKRDQNKFELNLQKGSRSSVQEQRLPIETVDKGVDVSFSNQCDDKREENFTQNRGKQFVNEIQTAEFQEGQTVTDYQEKIQQSINKEVTSSETIHRKFYRISVREVELAIIPFQKFSKFTIFPCINYTHFCSESFSDSDRSLVSNTQKQTTYSMKCQQDLISKKSSGVTSAEKECFRQKCDLLIEIKEKLERQCQVLTEELKKKSRDFEQLNQKLRKGCIQIEELRGYNAELEGELENREKYIKQKRQAYNECMKEINRLLQENQGLKNQKNNYPLSFDCDQNSITFQVDEPPNHKINNDPSILSNSILDTPEGSDPNNNGILESCNMHYLHVKQVRSSSNALNRLERCKSSPMINQKWSGVSYEQLDWNARADHSMFQELDFVYLSRAGTRKEKRFNGKLVDNLAVQATQGQPRKKITLSKRFAEGQKNSVTFSKVNK